MVNEAAPCDIISSRAHWGKVTSKDGINRHTDECDSHQRNPQPAIKPTDALLTIDNYGKTWDGYRVFDCLQARFKRIKLVGRISLGSPVCLSGRCED